MHLLSRLRQRHREPEIIDQPDLDEGLHLQALRGLERINWWSRSAGILWPPLRAQALQISPASLRVLDLATGAGDVPLRLWRKARRTGIPMVIEGSDRSPRAVAHAQRRAAALGADVRFFPWDALAGLLPEGHDVLTCSLFLHHLDEDQAVELLRRMAGAARRLVLINDLCRCVLGWLLAYAGTRVLSASPVVHSDGPLSVAGAFTRAEALDLARWAGLEGARVARRWPFRYLLSWQRPGDPK
jgi:2-polyprenyl-3-methyl-5-hydroxy-6-metoxy-1,4-benzoquinol methylase